MNEPNSPPPIDPRTPDGRHLPQCPYFATTMPRCSWCTGYSDQQNMIDPAIYLEGFNAALEAANEPAPSEPVEPAPEVTPHTEEPIP